jgi:hypothetical protein
MGRSAAAPPGVSSNRALERPEPAPAADGDTLSAVIEELRKRRPGLAAGLEDAHPVLAGNCLEVPEDDWLRSKLAGDANRQALEAALAAVCGPGASWRFSAAAPKPAAPAAASTASATRPPGGYQTMPATGTAGAPGTAETAEAAPHPPTVQTILDIFGGRVERIEEHGSFTEEER